MQTLTIPDALLARLTERAEKTGSPRDAVVLEALHEYLEDRALVLIVEERLRDPQPSVSLDEVKRDLGLLP